jgi:putative copper resistance protein D
VNGIWTVLVIARWLNFVAVAGLFGMALFPFYAPATTRRAYLAQPATRALAIAGGILALFSTAGWAGATLANMAGESAAIWDGQAWRSFLFDTSFGAAWIARGAIVLALALTIIVTKRLRASAAVAALSAGLLVSQAWVGHVASLAAPARWGVAVAYALHVIGAGAWFGGLVSLLIVMKGLPASRWIDCRDTEDVLTRFSTVGLVAVVAIIVGGAINTIAHSASAPALVAVSDWGQALVLKLALVAGMLLLACLNRFVLMPRLSKGEATAVPALTRSIVAEQVLGLVVLAATAALGVLDPSG